MGEIYRNTTKIFIEYLLAHSYPQSSIVMEWGNGKCAIDIAILGDDQRTPVAFYEIKGRKNPESMKRGIQQLRRACSMLSISASCSLVFSKNDAPFFEVVDISDIVHTNEELGKDQLERIMMLHQDDEPVPYAHIQSGASSKAIAHKEQKREEALDSMKKLCWIFFPIMTLFILFLDAYKIYELTSLRLIVIGAIVVIILLPFFNEISIKDFSFIRKEHKKES